MANDQLPLAVPTLAHRDSVWEVNHLICKQVIKTNLRLALKNVALASGHVGLNQHQGRNNLLVGLRYARVTLCLGLNHFRVTWSLKAGWLDGELYN